MKRIFFLSLALCIGYSSLPGQSKDSLWTATMDGEPQWMDFAMDGTLLVSYAGPNKASTGFARDLAALDPATGTVRWKYIAETPAGISYDYVPNTPYIQIRNVPMTIIDPSDGHTVFNISKYGISEIESYGFLLESGHIWICGKMNGERSISVFSLADGSMLWGNTDFLKQKNKVASKLAKFGALTGAGTPSTVVINLVSKPINHGKDALILATTNGIFHVQVATGSVDWQADLPDPNKGKMIKTEVGNGEIRLIPGRDNNFYAAKANAFTAYSYTDGKQLWNKLVKTSGLVDKIAYDEKGLILFPGSSNTGGVLSHNYIKMVNEKTGEELWPEDGIKFNGVVKKYLYTEKGLAVVMESESERNLVNFIDVAAGKFVLPKSVKLDGSIQYIEFTPKGLFYKTDRTANILDIANDKPLLTVPVQSKKEKPILSANNPDFFYFYSEDDNNVYEVNKKEGTSRQLSKAKIEFKGGESPANIEIRAGGVLLYSEHNATLITPSGDAKFNVYNPTPHKIDEIFSIVNKSIEDFLDVAEVDDIYSKNQKITNITVGTGDAAGRNQYDRINQAYATTGSAAYIRGLKEFPAIKARLAAMRKPKQRIYVMTKVDDRTVILAISKDDGSIVFQLPLAKRDEKPLYRADEISGYVFYCPKGSSLIGWPKGSQKSISAYKVQVP